MTFSGVQLADLNNYMRDYPSGIIVPTEFFWHSLYDALKSRCKSNPFYGSNVEILMQTSVPFTATAFGEDVDIPLADDLGFDKMTIPLREVIVNAGISKQALDNATGMPGSWGRIVDRVLGAQTDDFMWLMELCSLGDGTGRLARCASATGTGPWVVACDNTYCDFGWENTALFKVGMRVEVYNGDTAVIKDGVVTAVSFGSRNNGAATTGTVTISGTLQGGQNMTTPDGYVIYIRGTKSSGIDTSGKYSPAGPLPMGLVGLVQTGANYTDSSVNVSLSTFQGVANRGTGTALLRSAVWTASDFGGSAKTPHDWDLSVISDAIRQVSYSTGGNIDVLICSAELAMAIQRRSRTENGVNVVVGSPGASQSPVAAGARYATTFLGPDGRSIPIVVSRTVPRNCLYGLTSEDLIWFTKGNFDFLRMSGEIWDKSYGDRKANFEAPYGGYHQIGAERCDRAFVIQDMIDSL